LDKAKTKLNDYGIYSRNEMTVCFNNSNISRCYMNRYNSNISRCYMNRYNSNISRCYMNGFNLTYVLKYMLFQNIWTQQQYY